MEMTKALFGSLKEISGDYKEKNKETSVIRFLDKAIKTIDNVIKTMDVFLKKKGVDVGKIYGDAKKSSKNFIEKAGEKLAKDKDGNDRSIFKGLKTKGSDIAVKMLGKFSAFRTSGTPPPGDDNDTQTDSSAVTLDADKSTTKPSLRERASGGLDLLTEKLSLLVDRMPTKKPDDLNGDGIAEEGVWEKFKSRQNKRKKEVEEEKASLLARKEKPEKKGGGLLGFLSDKLMSLGGLITGGLWGTSKFLGKHLLKGIGRSVWWLGKKMVSGVGSLLSRFGPTLIRGIGSTLGGLFTRLIPGLSSGISGALQGVLGKGIKGAAGIAWSGLKMAGRAALPFAGQALSIAARGAAMLLTGPVGWAVAIGTVAYGGYKLYKYMTRNDISDDIGGKLTRLRLLSYGFGDDNKDSYSKIFELEMLMKDSLSFDAQTLKLKITSPDAEKVAAIVELFGISSEEPDRRAVLNAWFTKRFIPAYHAYIEALYSVNSSIYIDDIDKLKPEEVAAFLAKYTLPPIIHDHKEIPFFENTTTAVTKDQIESIITSIRSDNNPKIKRAALKPEERLAQEVVKAKAMATSEQAVKSALSKAMPTYKSNNVSVSNLPVGIGLPTEAETKPDTPSMMLSVANKATMGSINMAGGAIIPGDSTLPGISTSLKKEAIFNLDPKMLELFTGMAKEYNSLTGKNVQVNSAHRSMAEQARLYASMPAGRAAKPGASLHEYGLAVDINSADTKELERLGLLRKYGFTASVGGEPWHIEPIGVSLDPARAKTDMTFRSDAIAGSIGKGGGGYGLIEGVKGHGRNIELQRKIFGGAISEKPGEVVASNTVGIMAGASVAGAGSAATPVAGPVGVMTPASGASTASAAPIGIMASNIVTPPLQKPISETVASSANPNPASPDIEGEPTPKINDGLIRATLDKGAYATDRVVDSTGMNAPSGNNMSAMDAINQASKMTGVDANTLITFAKLESSLKTGAANSASSASGLFQITGPTWTGLVTKYGPKYGIPPNADKNNPLYNALMAAEYAKENSKYTEGHDQLGVSGGVALYLTHHFGGAGGKRILKALAANPNASVATAVSAAALASNKRALGNHTVASYIASLDAKFTAAQNTDANAYKPTGGTGASTATVAYSAMSTGGGYGSSAPQPMATTAQVPSSNTVSTSYSTPTSATTSTSSNVDPAFDYSRMQAATAAPTSMPVNQTLSTPTPTSTDPAFDYSRMQAATVTPTAVPTTNYQSSSVSVAPPPATPSTAGYDYTKPQAPVAPANYQSSSVSPAFDSSGVESLLNNQLTALTRIAAILSVMNGKFDIESLTDVLAGKGGSPAPAASSTQSAKTTPGPSTGVNMTRKSLT